MNVAVVGAGIMGSSAARFLAERGHAVTLFERYRLGHDRGSSHGRSRIVRKAYPDPFYTEIMQEGYPMWAELERASERRILYECGLLYFGESDSENVRSMTDGLASHGVPFEFLDPAQCGRVFPELKLRPTEVGVWTKEAGWVRADEAIKASIDLALRHGARIQHDHVESVEEMEKSFDAVVLTPGGWIGKLLEVPVEVQARTFCYLEARHDGPVWIDDGPGLHYGFPSEPDAETIKIGGHVCDFPFDPEREERPVVPENVEAIRELASRRFGIDDPKVTEAKMCLYTLRENEDFLIGRATEKTVFASPCSGHGFKFGPWVGKYLADLVEHKQVPSEYPRFDCRPRVLA